MLEKVEFLSDLGRIAENEVPVFLLQILRQLLDENGRRCRRVPRGELIVSSKAEFVVDEEEAQKAVHLIEESEYLPL